MDVMQTVDSCTSFLVRSAFGRVRIIFGRLYQLGYCINRTGLTAFRYNCVQTSDESCTVYSAILMKTKILLFVVQSIF